MAVSFLYLQFVNTHDLVGIHQRLHLPAQGRLTPPRHAAVGGDGAWHRDNAAREIRRRTRVVGSFPDGNSALMLVCA